MLPPNPISSENLLKSPTGMAVKKLKEAEDCEYSDMVVDKVKAVISKYDFIIVSSLISYNNQKACLIFKMKNHVICFESEENSSSLSWIG
jgi:hypothetical protein